MRKRGKLEDDQNSANDPRCFIDQGVLFATHVMKAEGEELPGTAFGSMFKNSIQRFVRDNPVYHYVSNYYFTTLEFHAMGHPLPENAYRGEEEYTYPPAPVLVQALRELLLAKNPCIEEVLGCHALAHITVLWSDKHRPVGMGNHIDGDNAHLLVGVGIDGPPRTLKLQLSAGIGLRRDSKARVVARLPVGTAYAFDAREVHHEPQYKGKGMVLLMRTLKGSKDGLEGRVDGLSAEQLTGLVWPTCKEIDEESRSMGDPVDLADYPNVMNRSASDSSDLTSLPATCGDDMPPHGAPASPLDVVSDAAHVTPRRKAAGAASPGTAPSPGITPSRSSARLRNGAPAGPDRENHRAVTLAKLEVAARNVLHGTFHTDNAGMDQADRGRLNALLTMCKPFDLNAAGFSGDSYFAYSPTPVLTVRLMSWIADMLFKSITVKSTWDVGKNWGHDGTTAKQTRQFIFGLQGVDTLPFPDAETASYPRILLPDGPQMVGPAIPTSAPRCARFSRFRTTQPCTTSHWACSRAITCQCTLTSFARTGQATTS